MIVVREVFQLHYGKYREAIAIVKEMFKAGSDSGGSQPRLLTDAVGRYYTLIMESEYQDLAAFEKSMAEEMGGEGMRELNDRFVPLVMEGRREIFRVVE